MDIQLGIGSLAGVFSKAASMEQNPFEAALTRAADIGNPTVASNHSFG